MLDKTKLFLYKDIPNNFINKKLLCLVHGILHTITNLESNTLTTCIHEQLLIIYVHLLLSKTSIVFFYKKKKETGDICMMRLEF